MIYKTFGCVAAVIAASGLATTTAVAESKEDTLDYPAMVEDIQIMQRVLQTALEKHFAGRGPAVVTNFFGADPGLALVWGKRKADSKYADAATHYYDLGQLLANPVLEASGTITLGLPQPAQFDIEGFHVPGTGVIYTLTFPTAVREIEPDEKPAAEEDLWNRMENEVRGKGSRTVWKVKTGPNTKQDTVDEDDLNRTIRVLVKTVGQYGARIEQLADHESIILAARADASLPGNALSLFDKPLLSTYLGFATSLAFANMNVASHRVIIEVPVSAITSFGAGEIDLDSLEQHTTITKYECGSPKPNTPPPPPYKIRKK